MKIICFAFFFFPLLILCQQKIEFLPEKTIAGVTDFFADDYGNFYINNNADLTFIKYNSAGNVIGELLFTLPFKIQSVQNPLNIPAFSENAQEVRFYDKNLSEIQTVKFQQKFGFIKFAFAEDHQQLWLVDDSSKSIIQYNYREEKIINKFSFFADFADVIDLIVHDKNIYILRTNNLTVLNFQAEKIKEIYLENARKLRRENNAIFVIGQHSIFRVEGSDLSLVFNCDECKIVDKNTSSFFAIRDNILYLYPLEKEMSTKP